MSTFHLDTFQGSLDFLLQLIQRKEVDLTELPLKQIIEQFQKSEDSPLEEGAEFIGSTSLLLFLKSKLLLPSLLQETQVIEEEGIKTLFTHLADYLKMREFSKELERREESLSLTYDKGYTPFAMRPTSFPSISLDELKQVLDKILERKTQKTREIEEETWQVADKIVELKKLLLENEVICLTELLDRGRCKEEVIATFLAILELIKGEELRVTRDLKIRRVNFERGD